MATPDFDGYRRGLGNPYTPNEDGRLGRELVVANSTDEASSTNAGAALDVAEATKRAALAPSRGGRAGGGRRRMDAERFIKTSASTSPPSTPAGATPSWRTRTAARSRSGAARAGGRRSRRAPARVGPLARRRRFTRASTDEGTDRIENENENENENARKRKRNKATNQNRSASSPFAVDAPRASTSRWSQRGMARCSRSGTATRGSSGSTRRFCGRRRAGRSLVDNAAAASRWFRSSARSERTRGACSCPSRGTSTPPPSSRRTASECSYECARIAGRVVTLRVAALKEATNISSKLEYSSDASDGRRARRALQIRFWRDDPTKRATALTRARVRVASTPRTAGTHSAGMSMSTLARATRRGRRPRPRRPAPSASRDRQWPPRESRVPRSRRAARPSPRARDRAPPRSRRGRTAATRRRARVRARRRRRRPRAWDRRPRTTTKSSTGP